MQTQLAAPPQHVVAGRRPFIGDQIAQLGFEQAGRNLVSEIVECAGTIQHAGKARSVGARQAARQRRRQPGPGLQFASVEFVAIAALAARQDRMRRPRRCADIEHRQNLVDTFLGEFAIRRDLPAPHIEQRRRGGFEFQRIIPRHRRRTGAFIVDQGTHAGVRPRHILATDAARKIAARHGAQVIDLLIADRDLAGVAVGIRCRWCRSGCSDLRRESRR